MTAYKKSSLQDALLNARLHDPFSYLGMHREQRGFLLRVVRQHDEQMWIRTAAGFEPMTRVHPQGIFEWRGDVAPDNSGERTE